MSEGPFSEPPAGNPESLPIDVNVYAFAVARAREIQTMSNSIKVHSGVKLAFQKLPKHMRRRTMAHNVKRLPRRLRQIHLQQMQKSGTPSKPNRTPLRKHRRRPRNLMDDYYRRQQRVKWLQTHIWHAKRFHMTEKWGYRLPHSPCSKSFKACYRGSAHHCLLQDISYFNCLELTGDKQKLLDNLNKITKADPGFGIGAKAFINGEREGCTTFFNFFRDPIGPVYFLWITGKSTKLWLWSHSAFMGQLMETLINLFAFSEIINEHSLNYYSNSDGLKLEYRRDLSRFRLIGPLSHSVVQNALKMTPRDSGTWLSFYLQNNESSFKNQEILWELLKNTSTTSQISSRRVLSLIVQDPRFTFPKIRTKVPSRNDSLIDDLQVKNVANSPLWDDSFREEIKKGRISNTEIIALRAQLLVPGSHIDKSVPIVPVVLIQHPGNNSEKIGYGSGWDIIMPSEWAQPFWLAFVMRGARCGGLRESDSIRFEMGRPDFLLPDTQAGLSDETETSEKLKEIYFKKPPNKRVNYRKLAIVSPLVWSWKVLLSDWATSPVDKFSVIRNKSTASEIKKFLKDKKARTPELIIGENALVPVKITALKKGVPKNFAIICIPESKDVKNEPTEPIRPDENKEKRNELRRKHKALLKKRRRLRVKMKKKKEVKIVPDKKVIEEFRKKMRELWLPEPTNIRGSCSREVCGFVKRGDFSFSSGKAYGIGYITSACLEKLKTAGNKILFRNINSRQYRLANLEIIE